MENCVLETYTALDTIGWIGLILVGLLIFLAGGIIGSVVDYKSVKKKYFKLKEFYDYLLLNGYIKNEKEVILSYLKEEEIQREEISDKVKYDNFKDDIL